MICQDCGENTDEFILHKDGCPKFGQEVQEFIEKYEAEIASWPEGARKALDDLNRMHSYLFGKLFAANMELDRLRKLKVNCEGEG